MNKKKFFRVMTIVYIISLGAVLGAVVYAGAVVAPNIFHSELILGKRDNIQYQEGLIYDSKFL